MGKKAVAVIGSEDEEQLRQKAVVKREQKKKRQGKVTPVVVEEPKEEPQKANKKMARVRGKSYQAAKAKVDVTISYPLSDAIKLLREISLTKFDATVELHLVLKEKGLSKEVELPHSTGKTRKIAIANDATIAKIESGQIDFDVLYASPEQMGKLVKFAKILGPRGLMPNPKNGTVVTDPAAVIKKLSNTSVVLKTEKDAPLIHTVVGKLSMTDAQLAANISAVFSSLSNISKAVLKSTMSPGIRIGMV